VDRSKIRGGQLNQFDFHQNQGAVAEQQQEYGNWMGAPEGRPDLPPDKAKAERIRHLLAEHGESVPQTEEHQPEEYEMEDRTNEDRDTSQPQMASEARGEDRQTDAEPGGEDFAPTHGRSPEVIREMMESRRATDRVPDPEDSLAGRPEQSQEKKEHGQTGRGTAARRTNKQPARAAKPAKAAKGKEAALDRSNPGVAKGTSAKKDDKQSASRQGTGRKGTGGATTNASGRQAGKQSATARGTKRAASSTTGRRATPGTGAKATTSKGGQQPAGRKGTAGASARSGARNTAGSKSAKSRTPANGKATASATKSRRTAAPTRSKSSTGRNR
jgi:hypothetical protein